MKGSYPQIIPICENGPSFTMHIVAQGDGGLSESKSGVSFDSPINRGLKGALKRVFIPYLKKLAREDAFHRENYREKMITYTFTGSIPKETKAAMEKARPDFKEGCLLMLADANTLHVSQKITKRVPLNRDPLIVGYHKDTPDLFWLIAAFDMTPVEALIANDALKSFYERKKL